jgi:hypothetical protein
MTKTADGRVCLDENDVEVDQICVEKVERERLCEEGFRPSCAEGSEMTKLDDGSKVCVGTDDATESAPICVETSGSDQKGGGKRGSKGGGQRGGKKGGR